jgi:hypothetical protein
MYVRAPLFFNHETRRPPYLGPMLKSGALFRLFELALMLKASGMPRASLGIAEDMPDDEDNLDWHAYTLWKRAHFS